MRAIQWVVASAVLLFVTAGQAHGGVIITETSESPLTGDKNQGWWSDEGESTGTNPGYFAGSYDQYRNFFSFDLGSFDFSDKTITAATLEVTRFHSTESFPKQYSLFDVSTPVAELNAGGSGRTDIFQDLGTGTLYGTYEVLAADSTELLVMSLDSDALNDLQYASGDYFSVGGRVASSEGYLFGGAFSGIPKGGGTQRLTIEYEPGSPTSEDLSVPSVPEPSSLAIFSVGASLLGCGVAAHRHPRRRSIDRFGGERFGRAP